MKKKSLDLKEKLALAVIDPVVAQTRAWQDTEEGFLSVEGKLNILGQSIDSSKNDIVQKIDEVNENLKKKLDEELFYEVDEQKIVDSVLAKVKIPDPIPGKDANEESIIKKVVPLVLGKIPVVTPEPIDVESIAKRASELIPKIKPVSIKKIDEEKIISSVLLKIPKVQSFKFELTQEDLLSKINKFDKEIDWKVLKNIPYDVLHGGSTVRGKKGGGGSSTFRQLNDVSLTNPTTGQVPIYNSVTGKWENGDVSGSSQNLQQVTDIGSTTTNSMTITDNSMILDGQSTPSTLKFTGMAVDTSTDTGGVEQVLNHNDTGSNRQLMIRSINATSGASTGIRYLIGEQYIAGIYGVDYDGSTSRPLNLSDNQGVSIGHVTLDYNQTLPALLSVYGDTTKDLLALVNSTSGGTTRFKVDPDGNTEIKNTLPELKMTTSGDDYYTRITRTTGGLSTRYNQSATIGTGFAINLDGSNYLTTGTTSAFNATTSFTIKGWVKLTTASNANGFLWVKWNGTDATAKFQMFRNGTGYTVRMGDGATSYANSGSGVIFNNTWCHVVMTYDGSRMKVYINGTLDLNWLVSISAYTGGGNMTWGSRGGGFTSVGLMDELSVYDYAWTQTDVTNNYNSGSGVYGTSSETGLLFGLHLDNNTTDYSSNSYSTSWTGSSSYVAGKILAGGTAGENEVTIWKSQDGTAINEYAITTFGDSNSSVIFNGLSHTFKIGGTTKATIAANGFFGINTTSPTSPLTLNASSASAAAFGLQSGGADVWSISGAGRLSLQTGGAFYISNGPSDLLTLGYNGKLRFDFDFTVSAGNAFTTIASGLQVTARTTSTVGLEAIGLASQTANIFNVKNSAGTVLVNVDASGNLNTTKGVKYSYVAKTANYTIALTDNIVDCTANSFDITLPTAVGTSGLAQRYVIKNSGTGIITIKTTSSQTIDGVASGVLTLVQWDSLVVFSDNANWKIE